MRSVFTIVALLAVNCIMAQIAGGDPSIIIGSNISAASNSSFKVSSNTEAVDGSPYNSEAFVDSKIIGIDQTVPLRYNVFLDQMEYENGNQVFSLDKSAYKTIYLNTIFKYIYTNYYNLNNELLSGYLQELLPNNNGIYKLYKKETIIFVPFKEAVNSYDSPKNAHYLKSPLSYFLNLENRIVQIPKNRKDVAHLFGSKEKIVLDYIKANKINLKEEVDLLKFVNFLNTI